MDLILTKMNATLTKNRILNSKNNEVYATTEMTDREIFTNKQHGYGTVTQKTYFLEWILWQSQQKEGSTWSSCFASPCAG